jgi:hypothetical protein
MFLLTSFRAAGGGSCAVVLSLLSVLGPACSGSHAAGTADAGVPAPDAGRDAGSDAGEADAGPEGITYADYERGLLEWQCRTEPHCIERFPAWAHLQSYLSDFDRCVRELRSWWPSPSPAGPLPPSASFDPVAAEQCLASLGSSCWRTDDIARIPACRRAVTWPGGGAEGSPCHAGAHCADDLWCEQSPGASCGTCQPRGESCVLDDACAQPEAGFAYCDVSCSLAAGSIRDRPLGAECGRVFEGETAMFATCAAGLVCPLFHRLNTGTCVERVAPGGTCGRDAESAPCALGYVCNLENTCEAVVEAAKGERCEPGLCDFGAREFCIHGECTPSDGTAGAPCSTSERTNCVPGTYCEFTLERCVELRSVGMLCSGNEQCASERCEGECVPAC